MALQIMRNVMRIKEQEVYSMEVVHVARKRVIKTEKSKQICCLHPS